MSPEEILRIAKMIVSGTPAMTIPAYARASGYIRWLIDTMVADIMAEMAAITAAQPANDRDEEEDVSLVPDGP